MYNPDFEVGTFPESVAVRKLDHAAGFRFVCCAGLSFSFINERNIIKIKRLMLR